MNMTRMRSAVLLIAGGFAGALLMGQVRAQSYTSLSSAAQQPAATSSSRAAPGAPSRGARYQYMCQTKWPERIYDPEVQRRLNELGQDGWHLLPPMASRPGPYADVYCFERAY